MTLLGVDRLLAGCLETLRALGKTVTAEVVARRNGYEGSPPQRTLRLKFGTNATPLRFALRTTGTHLSDPLATGLLTEAKAAETPWLLCAPYVSSAIGRRLATEHVSYVDSCGNCHIEAEGLLIAHVEGRKRIRESAARASGIKSHQFLFALLAQPDLVDAPVRKIALAAGIGKSTALELLGDWGAQGLLDEDPGGNGLRSGRVLLERWLTAYADVVRPAWLFARCESMLRDPFALEALIERVCENQEWAFGGSAAAFRMLPVNRGMETVLHMTDIPARLLERLQAVPAPNGSLSILRTPGTLPYQGAEPRLAHPLLVYTELLTSTEPQVMQTANSLRQQFLAEVA